ncbi:MAG: AAA family ATPase [Proteobacteria bacterium]|nr:AAA family ATPase [Pseudomonadota bacterium]
MTDWIKLKETKLRTGAVLEDYRDFEERRAYYVDKTWFIREFLQDPAQVVMYTRPRRFGKTLMLSTVRAFVEKEYDRDGNLVDKRPFFVGRKILDAEPDILEQMGKYPVIWYSLKDCNQVNFESFSLWMKATLARAARRHDYLRNSKKLGENEIKLFEEILSESLRVEEAAKAFVNLADWIYRDTGVKPIILIDEYDTPLQWAYEYGYYEKVLPIMRSMLGAALKTNGSFHKALLTGCLRISKESIFTGFNNPVVHSILNYERREYFGFTHEEVREMLHYYELDDEYSNITQWYDGYQFGENDVFNPYCLVLCLKAILDEKCGIQKGLPPSSIGPYRCYWSNSSGNAIINELIRKHPEYRSDVEALLAGETVEKPIYEFITYRDLDILPDVIWTFLLYAGYLKSIRTYKDAQEKIHAELKIVNREVWAIFPEFISRFLSENIRKNDLPAFYQDLWGCKDEKVKTYINKLLVSTISYYDQKESFYHGIMTGILSCIADVEIKSNRESGNGRPDIILRDYNNARAIVFEFKYSDNLAVMKRDLALAVQQIHDKAYGAELLAEGFEQVVGVAIAFFAKRSIVQTMNLGE